MPHYFIHVASSEGALESQDREGITLDGIGLMRALVTETLVEAARERPAPGTSRTITVTACDEHGSVVHSDSAKASGGSRPDSNDAAVGRAIRAMNC